LNSKDFVDRLMNFTNSWEGLPWVDKATVSTTDAIYAKQGKHERGTVPEAVSFLTAGIDVQDGYFYWSVYGWGEGASSYLIDYGRADTWLQLENILVNGVYKSKTGSEFMVARIGIDSGYDTDSVYRWCSRFAGVALPLKGSNTSLLGGYYKVSSIDRAGYGGLKLYVLDTQKLKDAVSGRIKQPLFEPGSWHSFKDLPDDFARQMVSEQKITRQDRKTGKITSE
jgi:phage terminase large subunit GpA-like protein